MDELTQLIKKNIKYKYSSTRRFSEELGIPQTTIVSAIKNGVSGTAFTTVCKMCKALDIKLMNGIYPVVVTDTTTNLIEKLSKLDEKGIHTVSTVLEMEYVRCQTEAEAMAIAEKNAKLEAAKHNPIISLDQIPSKAEVGDLAKALTEQQEEK
ncbi:MAG: hypothetical protein LUH40_05870 [Clostridiales bacterium]|nr:hypothetical protein [Clostridiales bacterium]